jgi:hypothetical protein
MTVFDKEVWKNVAAAPRHYICFTSIGELTSKVVQAGRTFTCTSVERRLNQEAVYDAKVDPFRDGTFILVKETDDTVHDEIESVDSITDQEIEVAVNEAIGGDPVRIDTMLRAVSGINTANRILEELVVQDASSSLVNAAKELVDKLTDKPIGDDGNPITIGSREVISTAMMADTGTRKDWKTKVE